MQRPIVFNVGESFAEADRNSLCLEIPVVGEGRRVFLEVKSYGDSEFRR
jgi:hypothetical protein